MLMGTRRAPGLPALLACAWVVFFAGCFRAESLERAGVSLRPSERWRPVAKTTWPVPGTPLAAWSGPEGSSLVVYRSLPVPGGSPAEIATGLATRLENMPGLSILERGSETAGGMTASRVEAVAPGTGDAFAPTGRGTPTVPPGKVLVPTRRIVVTFVRGGDTISLVWHAPEANASVLESQAAETLKTLTLDRNRLATSSY